MTTMRRKLAVFGLVVFGLCLAAQLTVVKLHLPNSPPRTMTIHFELPIPPSIWDASAVLLTVPALAVLLLAAFCHRSLGRLEFEYLKLESEYPKLESEYLQLRGWHGWNLSISS